MQEGHVYTCVRVRPAISRGHTHMRMEIDHSKSSLKTIKDIKMISKASRTSTETKFSVDHIFDESCKTKDVFSQTWPLLQKKIFRGENANFSVYGQTGSGKTYTVDGLVDCLLPRLFQDLNEISTTVTVSISYIQIYCDSVYDLLDKNRLIVSSKAKFSEIESILKVSVQTPADVMSILKKTQHYKRTSEHALNKLSSRSHTILKFSLCFMKPNSTQQITPSLYIVDLAGSERNSRTRSRGMLLEESCQINKSLSCLAKCLECMTHGYSLIPFRESALTMFLRDALNRSGFILVCCISPEQCNENETISTMKFATLARRIVSQRQSTLDHSKRKNMRVQYEEKLQHKLTEQKTLYEKEIELLKKRLVTSQMTGLRHQQCLDDARSRLSLVKQHNSQQATMIQNLKAKNASVRSFDSMCASHPTNKISDPIKPPDTLKIEKVCSDTDIQLQKYEINSFLHGEECNREILIRKQSDSWARLLNIFATGVFKTIGKKEKLLLNEMKSSKALNRTVEQWKDLYILQRAEEMAREALFMDSFYEQQELLQGFQKKIMYLEINKDLSTQKQKSTLSGHISEESAPSNENKCFPKSSVRKIYERILQKLTSKEILLRLRIEKEEKFEWTSFYQSVVKLYSMNNERNKIITKEERRRLRIESHALQMARTQHQKLSKHIICELSCNSEKADQKRRELHKAFVASQERFLALLEDNKTLLRAFDRKEQQIQVMLHQYESIKTLWCLDQDEMNARFEILFSSLLEQNHAVYWYVYTHLRKYQIAYEAYGSFCHQISSFWSKLTAKYSEISITQAEKMNQLFEEIEENSEIYARKSLESDDWQSEAFLWKNRCDSLKKVSIEKSIINLPEIMDRSGNASVGSGFDRFPNAIIRLAPGRKTICRDLNASSAAITHLGLSTRDVSKKPSSFQKHNRQSTFFTANSTFQGPRNSNGNETPPTNNTHPKQNRPRSPTARILSTPVCTSPTRPTCSRFSPQRRACPNLSPLYRVSRLSPSTVKRGNNSKQRLLCTCSICSPVNNKE